MVLSIELEKWLLLEWKSVKNILKDYDESKVLCWWNVCFFVRWGEWLIFFDLNRNGMGGV